jgi:hypothetical protein
MSLFFPHGKYATKSGLISINASFASQMSCFNALCADLKLNFKAIQKKEVTAYIIGGDTI